jgi:hypothetical protein
MLDSLRPITSAAWNATGADDAHRLPISTCTPGTRVSLLEDLMAWATASDSSCVFWLNGLAGTGKSTIARTLCERLDTQGLLGASFFISRDQSERRDASNIVRSIAHQLAVRWRPVADALCTELCETPTSKARSLRQQITDFIIIPARALPAGISFIIVIDALDEAVIGNTNRPGGDLLLLLVHQLLQLASRAKLLITSRNEIPIQKMFRELSATPETVDTVKLHELDKVVVKDDIAIYLDHSFTVIRNTQLDLELVHGTWPSAEDIARLTELSGLLFIYAATAIRFVENPKYHPRSRLTQLLRQGQQSAGASPYGELDALYRQILEEAVLDPGGDEAFLCQRLQAVVAVIVLAQTPLNIQALANLSDIDVDDFRIVVGQLSSLLEDGTSIVRVFHPSFPDFVSDAARCKDPRFRVVPPVDHGIIALRCLLLMNEHLRYNMCNLADHTVANEDVEGLDQVLCENVSDALRYAVCFWCTHLTASDSTNGSLLDALEEFCRRHLFHWVELLSLLEQVPRAEMALLEVIEWCEVCDSIRVCGQMNLTPCPGRDVRQTPRHFLLTSSEISCEC